MEKWEEEFEQWFKSTGRSEEFKARYRAVWKECFDMQKQKFIGIIGHLSSIIQILKSIDFK